MRVALGFALGVLTTVLALALSLVWEARKTRSRAAAPRETMTPEPPTRNDLYPQD